jgi:hypothetical protein
MAEQFSELRNYFNIDDGGSVYVVQCNQCESRFELVKHDNGQVDDSSIEPLLNCARGERKLPNCN